MNVDLHLVLGFVVAVALLSLAPGPDLLFIIANGATGGRRAGLVAAVGMSTGSRCTRSPRRSGWVR